MAPIMGVVDTRSEMKSKFSLHKNIPATRLTTIFLLDIKSSFQQLALRESKILRFCCVKVNSESSLKNSNSNICFFKHVIIARENLSNFDWSDEFFHT